MFPSPKVVLTGVQFHEAEPEDSVTSPIPDLCATLASWPADGTCCGYLSADACRYYLYAVSNQTCAAPPAVVHLDQLLRADGVPLPSRSQRYSLALIMASSFLQLLESPWLPATFRTSDIFFVRSADAEGREVLQLEQPHMRRQFGAGGDTSPDGQAAAFESLDQLGIMLLELCFGQVLEDQPCRSKWPDGRNKTEREAFDVAAARDWQCRVGDEAGPDYAEAVAWCLGGNRSSPDRWREAMLGRVIRPLQRCRDYLADAKMRVEDAC